VEHGLVPSVLAARLTYLGAPDSFQAAVSAGLSGLGSVFVGSIEGAAHMLQDGLVRLKAGDAIEAVAADIVAQFRKDKKAVPGIGHPIHKEADPRTARLLQIAAENGFSGRHVELLHAVTREAERATGRHLPINVSGAIGAIASELGLDWRICRGIGLIARSIGLVAHLLEEIRNPIARELWLRTEEEAQAGEEE
jgi:citrate synthase